MPPHDLMKLPWLSNLTTRATVSQLAPAPWPLWPSATKMSPFGATCTSFGSLRSGPDPSPATPGRPSVSMSSPSGLNLKTAWPLPS